MYNPKYKIKIYFKICNLKHKIKIYFEKYVSKYKNCIKLYFKEESKI